MDIGNQFEFNVDCSLNGPYSRLLKRSISTYIDIQSRGLVFFEMKVAFWLQASSFWSNHNFFFVLLCFYYLHLVEIRETLTFCFKSLKPNQNLQPRSSFDSRVISASKAFQHIRGQIISEWLLEVFIWTKKRTNLGLYFCPSL